MLRGYFGAVEAKSSSQLIFALKFGTKISLVVCTLSIFVTGAMMWLGSWESCTTEGPYGHQIWAMLLVPDPTIRLQQWLYPGWVEAMPSLLPLPVVRYCCWVVYMSQASTAFESNQRTDFGWRTLGFLGPPLCAFFIVTRGYEWGSMWCHLASIVAIFYLIAPWFEGWKRKTSPTAIWVDMWLTFTEPNFAHCGWEHVNGWKENPEMTALGVIPFGPDYRKEVLWRPVWPKAKSFPGYIATKEDWHKMFEAWELAKA
eukprot:gene19330-33572_t